MRTDACFFCGEPTEMGSYHNFDRVFWVRCDACGPFALTGDAKDELEPLAKTSTALVNLSAETLKRIPKGSGVGVLWKRAQEKEEGRVQTPTEPPHLNIEDFVGSPILHANKPHEILRLLGLKLANGTPFDAAQLTLADIRGVRISGWQELAQWMLRLSGQGLVDKATVLGWVGPRFEQMQNQVGAMPPIRLTPDGWKLLGELYGSVGSKTAFIAMSFTLPERDEVQRAIEAACQANGWEPRTVDQVHYLGAIVDRIRLEINRSRFVIADFTENKRGVYFEAGYAEGRGIPVIYSVRKDSVGDLHFDTKHLNYIVWETTAELQQWVTDRIGAVIRK